MLQPGQTQVHPATHILPQPGQTQVHHERHTKPATANSNLAAASAPAATGTSWHQAYPPPTPRPANATVIATAYLHQQRHTLLGHLLIHHAHLAQADPGMGLHRAGGRGSGRRRRGDGRAMLAGRGGGRHQCLQQCMHIWEKLRINSKSLL